MSKRFTIFVCAVIVFSGLAALIVGVALRQVPGCGVLSGVIIAFATIGTGIAVSTTIRRYRISPNVPPRG
jgi:hypothetical protein